LQLHHVVDGPADAPTLVLGGSLGTTLDMWAPQVRALSPRLRVLRYDHRGHGGSPVPTGPYALDDLGTDVLELMDGQRLERAHVAGLSLGGMVSMWLAVHAPDRVDRLALLCTSARLGPVSAWEERAATVRSHGTSAVAATVVGRWFTPELAEQRPGLIAEFVAMISAIEAEGYASCCEAIAAMDLLDRLPRVHAPTLVIAGERDPATPPEHARAIAERVPGARLEILPGVAHLASWERADDVNALLLDHFCGYQEAP
jgi:3-oxoadipate enol-lactonase